MTSEQYERFIGLSSRVSGQTALTPEKTLATLHEAARTARRGHLAEAEVLISGLPLDGPLGATTLDLKARLCAQQGRLVEAQLCWMEAIRLSPGNDSYRRSLSYLTHLLRPQRSPTVFGFAMLLIILTLLILCFCRVGILT